MGENLYLVRLLVQLFIAIFQYCTMEYKYSRLIPERLKVNLGYLFCFICDNEISQTVHPLPHSWYYQKALNKEGCTCLVS